MDEKLKKTGGILTIEHSEEQINQVNFDLIRKNVDYVQISAFCKGK
jgi:hypothetical protein